MSLPSSTRRAERWIVPDGTHRFTCSRAGTNAPTTAFAIAFSYLEDLLWEGSPARARLRGIAPGKSERIELGDGVFAMEQVYEP